MIGGATNGVGVTPLYTTAFVTNAGLVKGIDTGIRMSDGGIVVNQNGGTIRASILA